MTRELSKAEEANKREQIAAWVSATFFKRPPGWAPISERLADLARQRDEEAREAQARMRRMPQGWELQLTAEEQEARMREIEAFSDEELDNFVEAATARRKHIESERDTIAEQQRLLAAGLVVPNVDLSSAEDPVAESTAAVMELTKTKMLPDIRAELERRLAVAKFEHTTGVRVKERRQEARARAALVKDAQAKRKVIEAAVEAIEEHDRLASQLGLRQEKLFSVRWSRALRSELDRIPAK